MIYRRKQISNGRLRVRLGLIIVFIGFLVFLLGADPGLFNMDRSPVIGFVQIAVFLVGLAMICVGGYVCLNGLWNGDPKTIAADFGLRLVSTGYVIAVISGMADMLGFGSQTFPELPYFGPWQAGGVLLGELVIAFGFMLLIPPRHRQKRNQPRALSAENENKVVEDKKLEILIHHD